MNPINETIYRISQILVLETLLEFVFNNCCILVPEQTLFVMTKTVTNINPPKYKLSKYLELPLIIVSRLGIKPNA